MNEYESYGAARAIEKYRRLAGLELGSIKVVPNVSSRAQTMEIQAKYPQNENQKWKEKQNKWDMDIKMKGKEQSKKEGKKKERKSERIDEEEGDSSRAMSKSMFGEFFGQTLRLCSELGMPFKAFMDASTPADKQVISEPPTRLDRRSLKDLGGRVGQLAIRKSSKKKPISFQIEVRTTTQSPHSQEVPKDLV